jgi:hypothetical protein
MSSRSTFARKVQCVHVPSAVQKLINQRLTPSLASRNPKVAAALTVWMELPSQHLKSHRKHPWQNLHQRPHLSPAYRHHLSQHPSEQPTPRLRTSLKPRKVPQIQPTSLLQSLSSQSLSWLRANQLVNSAALPAKTVAPKTIQRNRWGSAKTAIFTPIKAPAT